MLGNITETKNKTGGIMTTVNEQLSSFDNDEYAEDLNDYFGDNPYKKLYKDIS
jgi:hypothetical protein